LEAELLDLIQNVLKKVVNAEDVQVSFDQKSSYSISGIPENKKSNSRSISFSIHVRNAI
jgi:hypothetical protein